MSELINNREFRQKQLKALITELHDGKSVEEVKEKFAKLIEGVAASEISEMEQALIEGGMPVEEIQRLCDVHAAVFKGSIEEIHSSESADKIKGHPLHTLKLENRALEELIDNKIIVDLEAFYKNDNEDNKFKLLEGINLLWDIDKHYKRKENLIFPYMEKYGITAPPKVMWGVDDEIRASIKEIKNLLLNYSSDSKDKLKDLTMETLEKIKEMIFKEESILIPMIIDTLSVDEWIRIDQESDEIGYCIIAPNVRWKPEIRDEIAEEEKTSELPTKKGYVKFNSGILSTKEIGAIFNTLPIDITFVDKDGLVKYFSEGKERIFHRSRSIIGREVSNCHPPASVHIVEQIVEDLKSGKKDNEDFWIKLGDVFAYIRYFAVRDEKGEFLGVLEASQNIKPIQELEGEKRLMS